MYLQKLLLFCSVILLPGCGSRTGKQTPSQVQNEYGISYAQRFNLKKINEVTEVDIINPWQGAADVKQTYYLVKRGSELPEGIDVSSIIFVPIQKIICMSTTYLAMIAALHEEKSVAGVSGSGFIYSSEVLKNVENGLTVDVGYEANLNKELILKTAPDLLMIYGIGSESTAYVGKIKELGIKVIINADYLETDPLSRAEWIKLFGALYCKETLADSIFNSEVSEYRNIATIIEHNISKRPKVLLGLPFKDTWYISPANSYISKLIYDAGGEYLWNDTESSASMPYGIENVYLRALKADYWLNTGSAVSLDEISGIDFRLSDLPCFKYGKLFNNNNRVTARGGNDFWESGSIHPHLLLKDIATILHPELFMDDTLLYYRKLN